MTSTPATPADRSQAPRRALAVALPGGAVGAAVVLVASGQTWSEGSTTFGTGTLGVEATGSDVTGLPSALALVGLAALVAVFAVRRAGRAVVAGLLALAGLGTMVAALAASADTGALEEKAAEATGLADAAVGQVTHSAWPYIAAAGGFLLLVAGVLALRYGRYWPAMGGRYERGGRTARRRTAAPADPERPEEMWQALDRGEDPTGPEHATRPTGSDPGTVLEPGPGTDPEAGPARPAEPEGPGAGRPAPGATPGDEPPRAP